MVGVSKRKEREGKEGKEKGRETCQRHMREHGQGRTWGRGRGRSGQK